MFYTGTCHEEDGLIQRVGAAVSDDLNYWVKHPSNPLLDAHPSWYEQLDLNMWFDQAWRDPWVYPVEDGFEMLVTARAKHGPARDRGVIGRAFSSDLTGWRALPPLTAPGGFGQMEVPQRLVMDGEEILLFSCGPKQLAPSRAAGEKRRRTAICCGWTDRVSRIRLPMPLRSIYQISIPSARYRIRAVVGWFSALSRWTKRGISLGVSLIRSRLTRPFLTRLGKKRETLFLVLP